MTVLPLLIPTRRVLAVAPSRVVRDQLVDAFATVDVLRRAGALPETGSLPRVRRVEHRLGDAAQWETAAEHADVVVGTVNCLSPAVHGVAQCPDGLFDLLIVDEAHHAPAPTWRALLESFGRVRAALFTATPFRRDRRELPADIEYRYRLGQALDDGILATITFRPVQLIEGADHDAAIVATAVERLHAPEHVAAGSLLLVRTDRLADGELLRQRYAEAGVPLGFVTNKSSRRRIRQVVADCNNGNLRGIISVGVLGEGFDLPRLKIAAYHRPHRSLPATLQFIGRIARAGPDLGPAELIAVRQDIQDDTRRLYAEDADWARVVPDLADAAIDDEHARRAYLAEFDRPAGDLSLAALRPTRQVQLYRLSEDEADNVALGMQAPVDVFARGRVVYSSTDRSGRLRVVVTEHLERPDWVDSGALDACTYQLHLAVWEPRTRLLYVHAPTDQLCADFVAALGIREPQRAGPGHMGRLMHRLNVIEYFSVGMRATRAPGGLLATYQTKAGTAVGSSVGAADSLSYTTGHLIARVVDPFEGSGQIMAVGMSVRRSKVWTPGHVDLLTFRRWCSALDHLVSDGDPAQPTAPGLPLRMPTEITRFPEAPIAAQLQPALLTSQWLLSTPAGPRPLIAANFETIRRDDHHLDITVIVDDTPLATFTLDALGALSVPDGGDVMLVAAGTARTGSLLEALTDVPPYIFYADGSSTFANLHNSPADELPPLPDECMRALDWTGVAIHAESGQTKDGAPTVQRAAADAYLHDCPHAIVINDDSRGEIADLIIIDLPASSRRILDHAWRVATEPAAIAAAMTDADTPVQVSLAHCKWAGADKPRRNLRDIEEVVGQANRSARWTTSTQFWTELAHRCAPGGRARIWAGDPEDVRALLEIFTKIPPDTRFEIHIVQPSLDVARFNNWTGGRTLLSATREWTRQHGAEFRVLGAN